MEIGRETATVETLPFVTKLDREKVRERPGIDAVRIELPETWGVLVPENALAVPVRTPVLEERKPVAMALDRTPLAATDVLVPAGEVRSLRTGREPTTVRAPEAVDRAPEAVTVLEEDEPTADPTPLLGESTRGEEAEDVAAELPAVAPERHGETAAERVAFAGAVRTIDPAFRLAEDAAEDDGPIDLVAGPMLRGVAAAWPVLLATPEAEAGGEIVRDAGDRGAAGVACERVAPENGRVTEGFDCGAAVEGELRCAGVEKDRETPAEDRPAEDCGAAGVENEREGVDWAWLGAENDREGVAGAENDREGVEGAEKDREGVEGAEKDREGVDGAEKDREGVDGAENEREGAEGVEGAEKERELPPEKPPPPTLLDPPLLKPPPPMLREPPPEKPELPREPPEKPELTPPRDPPRLCAGRSGVKAKREKARSIETPSHFWQFARGVIAGSSTDSGAQTYYRNLRFWRNRSLGYSKESLRL
jgi:hypothetical protein